MSLARAYSTVKSIEFIVPKPPSATIIIGASSSFIKSLRIYFSPFSNLKGQVIPPAPSISK